MIKIIKKIKNNKRLTQYRACSGSGFVILFAVTLSAVLLAIALGVANIALKEVKFSTSAKDTNEAFFAADTGTESALFQDKNGDICSPDPSCSFPITGLGSSGEGCAKVSVTKSTDIDTGAIATTIISKGYNVGSDSGLCIPPKNSIEREIETTY